LSKRLLHEAFQVIEDELSAGALAADGASVVAGEASGRVRLLRLDGFEERRPPLS
jgi:hypothetical protein